MYEIRAQGYGGSGASIPPITVNTISEAKEEIADLLSCDHAVQLYKIEEDGSKKAINFESYTSYSVVILE